MLKLIFKANMPLDKGDLDTQEPDICKSFRSWFPSRSQVSLPLPTSYIMQWHPLLVKAWLISSLSKAIMRMKQLNLITHRRKKTALFVFQSSLRKIMWLLHNFKEFCDNSYMGFLYTLNWINLSKQLTIYEVKVFLSNWIGIFFINIKGHFKWMRTAL